MNDADSLKHLKAGDGVAMFTGFDRDPDVAVIDKVTPSGRIVIRGMTFDQSGWKRGRSSSVWGRTHIKVLTEDLLRLANRKQLLRNIRNVKWENLSNEVLERCYQSALKP